jgi:hypothetical protein
VASSAKVNARISITIKNTNGRRTKTHDTVEYPFAHKKFKNHVHNKMNINLKRAAETEMVVTR